MLYVLTGGARSGKSAAAEGLAADLGVAVVVAAAGSSAGDEEMAARIARHRQARPREWRVIEIETASYWAPAPEVGEAVLLECMGTLLGRVMAETAEEYTWADAWEGEVVPDELVAEVGARNARITESCAKAAGRSDAHVIVVTNEVGDGVVPAYASGRLFRDAMGRANRALVDAADGAWLVVAGRCVDLTSLPARPPLDRDSGR